VFEEPVEEGVGEGAAETATDTIVVIAPPPTEDTVVTFNFDHIDQQMLDNILRISESHGSGLMFDGPH
jgi:hypothetical protein